MTAREAHPVADLFPMLAADELAELAADIKARGLIQPIVLDVDGRILDGRNRLAACELAGIVPTFATYDGEDPDGYAVAVNIARRHMTKGQQAIVVAQARRYSSGITQQSSSAASGISQPAIAKADAVIAHAPDLADRVLSAGLSLSEAYEIARDRKRQAEEARADLARLRSSASDLAVHVDEERMSLADAIAALDAREAKAKREEEERRTAAQREADQLKQERLESLKRDRERIQMVVTGWSTIRDLILPDPDGERAAEIVAGLGENDRLALKRLIADITE